MAMCFVIFWDVNGGYAIFLKFFLRKNLYLTSITLFYFIYMYIYFFFRFTLRSINLTFSPPFQILDQSSTNFKTFFIRFSVNLFTKKFAQSLYILFPSNLPHDIPSTSSNFRLQKCCGYT